MKIFYITVNRFKFENAKRYADKFGIKLVQKKLKIQEIQSDSIENIARDKAMKAFKILKRPLVVSDSGWDIVSLKGFPGPYMHYINKWLEAEDFLKLMKDKKNKSVVLEYVFCAVSSKGSKLFKKKIKGKFVNRASGKGLSFDRVIKLGKSKHTIAKCQSINQEVVDENDIWQNLFNWSKTA